MDQFNGGGWTDLTMALLDLATLADVTQEGSADISSFDIRTRITVDGYENGALMVRPFAAAGLSVYGQDATTGGEFVTEGGSVSTQFQIDAGLKCRPCPDISVSAGLLAEFGDLSAVGGSFRLSKAF